MNTIKTRLTHKPKANFSVNVKLKQDHIWLFSYFTFCSLFFFPNYLVADTHQQPECILFALRLRNNSYKCIPMLANSICSRNLCRNDANTQTRTKKRPQYRTFSLIYIKCVTSFWLYFCMGTLPFCTENLIRIFMSETIAKRSLSEERWGLKWFANTEEEKFI